MMAASNLKHTYIFLSIRSSRPPNNHLIRHEKISGGTAVSVSAKAESADGGHQKHTEHAAVAINTISADAETDTIV